MMTRQFTRMVTLAIAMALAIAFLAQPAVSQSDPYAWSKQYNDPVKLALEQARIAPEVFSSVGYAAAWAVYRIGGGVAMNGGAYLLLESPSLDVDIVTANFYGLAQSIASEALKTIIEESIRTPGVTCKKLAQCTIDKGLADYKEACAIIDQYRRTKTLSKQDAIRFLDRRWSVFKLGSAKQLYNDIITTKYSIDKQVADKGVSELIGFFQSRVGAPNWVPLATVALLLRDVEQMEMSKKLGLANYKPYLDFMKNMDLVNRYRIAEAKKFSGKLVRP